MKRVKLLRTVGLCAALLQACSVEEPVGPERYGLSDQCVSEMTKSFQRERGLGLVADLDHSRLKITGF